MDAAEPFPSFYLDDSLCDSACGMIGPQWPFLLTWFNFNPGMDK